MMYYNLMKRIFTQSQRHSHSSIYRKCVNIKKEVVLLSCQIKNKRKEYVEDIKNSIRNSSRRHVSSFSNVELKEIKEQDVNKLSSNELLEYISVCSRRKEFHLVNRDYIRKYIETKTIESINLINSDISQNKKNILNKNSYANLDGTNKVKPFFNIHQLMKVYLYICYLNSYLLSQHEKSKQASLHLSKKIKKENEVKKECNFVNYANIEYSRNINDHERVCLEKARNGEQVLFSDNTCSNYVNTNEMKKNEMDNYIIKKEEPVLSGRISNNYMSISNEYVRNMFHILSIFFLQNMNVIEEYQLCKLFYGYNKSKISSEQYLNNLVLEIIKRIKKMKTHNLYLMLMNCHYIKHIDMLFLKVLLITVVSNLCTLPYEAICKVLPLVSFYLQSDKIIYKINILYSKKISTFNQLVHLIKLFKKMVQYNFITQKNIILTFKILSSFLHLKTGSINNSVRYSLNKKIKKNDNFLKQEKNVSTFSKKKQKEDNTFDENPTNNILMEVLESTQDLHGFHDLHDLNYSSPNINTNPNTNTNTNTNTNININTNPNPNPNPNININTNTNTNPTTKEPLKEQSQNGERQSHKGWHYKTNIVDYEKNKMNRKGEEKLTLCKNDNINSSNKVHSFLYTKDDDGADHVENVDVDNANNVDVDNANNVDDDNSLLKNNSLNNETVEKCNTIFNNKDMLFDLKCIEMYLRHDFTNIYYNVLSADYKKFLSKIRKCDYRFDTNLQGEEKIYILKKYIKLLNYKYISFIHGPYILHICFIFQKVYVTWKDKWKLYPSYQQNEVKYFEKKKNEHLEKEGYKAIFICHDKFVSYKNKEEQLNYVNSILEKYNMSQEVRQVENAVPNSNRIDANKKTLLRVEFIYT